VTDQQTDPKPADGGQDQGAEHKHDVPTMDDVRKVVDDALQPIKDMLSKVTGGGDGKPADAKPADAKPGAADPAGGIDAMIEAAITKVLGDKDKKDKADQHEAEHAKLREAAAERTPVDRPKRARWLGGIYDK
jgi:hypothetical protein